MAAHIAERRPLGALGRMGLVVGAHAALLFGIAGGLGVVPLPKFTEMTATVIDEFHPPPPETTPEKFRVEPNEAVQLPLPEPPPMPVDNPTDTITATLVPIDRIPEGPGSAVVEPRIEGARPDPRRPLSQPAYPPEMIRLGAQGAVEVELFVQPDGRVADARIVKTSGYDAFDRNTLDEAKRKWRLIPATRDGVATPQWYRMRVVFKLKNQ
jgi:protein TonB